MTQARRSIGKTTTFLAKADKKFLTVDLWNYFDQSNNGDRKLNRTLRAKEGRTTTVIIAKNFPNACTIDTLLASNAAAVNNSATSSHNTISCRLNGLWYLLCGKVHSKLRELVFLNRVSDRACNRHCNALQCRHQWIACD